MKSFPGIIGKLEKYLTTSTLVSPENSDSIKRFAAHDVTPLATLKCTSIIDTQTAVKFCNDNAIEFVVKSGGKNQASTSIRQNALVLDLSPLKKISHELKNNKMWLKMEAGVNFYELQEYLSSLNSKNNIGFTVPLAWDRGISCIGAHTIMGNGLTHRKCGLGVDLIKQAKVLLANGEIVVANEENNADLLWGVKGCGPFLGIVLEIIEQVPENCNFVDPNARAQIRLRSYSFPIKDSLNFGKSLANLIQSTEDKVLPYTILTMNKNFSAIYLMVYQMLYSKVHNKILQQNNENIDKTMKQMSQKYNGKSFYQNGYIYDKMCNTLLKEKQPGKKYYYIWGGYTTISALPEVLHKISSFYSSNPLSAFKSDDVSIGTNIVPIKSNVFQTRDASKASIPIQKSEEILIYGNINFTDKASHEQCYNYIKRLQLFVRDLMKVGSICDFNKKDTTDPETSKWIFGKNYQKIKSIHQKYDPLNKFSQGLF